MLVYLPYLFIHLFSFYSLKTQNFDFVAFPILFHSIYLSISRFDVKKKNTSWRHRVGQFSINYLFIYFLFISSVC